MQKILIIDDEPHIREVLVSYLVREGFQTIEAENGRAGVQLARAYLPDLILSDIKMDGFDGYAALAAIRYQPLTSTTPVVLMTGQPDEEGRRFAMELGADDYLIKPFALPDVLAAIRVQLKKRDAIKNQALRLKAANAQRVEEAFESEALPDQSVGDLMSTERSPLFEAATPCDAARIASRELGLVRGAEAMVPRGAGSFQQIGLLVETYLQMLNHFHPNLGNTAMRAVVLCRTLAELLELSPEESMGLCWAAALHDISLVGLDRDPVSRWLQDPRRVTEEEDAFIKKHPLESQQMLERLPIFKTAGQAIRSHHEHWDGTGYPDGLKQEIIPWLARLLAPAVCYCCQHVLGAPALKIVKAQSGTLFDPRAVENLVEAVALAKIPQGIREILLNEMKAGEILAQEIHNAVGMVLLRRGRHLTDAVIQKVMAINRVTPLDQRVLVYC